MRSFMAVLSALTFMGLGADVVNFDALTPGSAPSAWTIESHGKTGPKWIVKADPTAPSRPNVLEQATGGTSEADLPIAIFDKTVCRDGDLSVKFRINGGRRIRTAGVVWRYVDANNYYLLHLSADENNITLYRVRDGKPEAVPPLGSPKGQTGVHHNLKVGEWYITKVIFRGSKIRVLFGNRRLFEAEDNTITGQGRTGIWTRGHTIASFDDFRIDKKG